MPDKGIPEEVLQHAKCVAVIPHMVKGGFVFGAEGGKGVATCRTPNGWSAPAFITISGGSWGLQIGVEAVDVVMIFQNDKAMQRLPSSIFQVGGDASAAAGPVGRHAEAGTDLGTGYSIPTYSRAKGAFAGLTLTGASLRQDSDSRRAMYGHNVTTRASPVGQSTGSSCSRAIPGGSSRSQSSGQSGIEQSERELAVSGCRCLSFSPLYVQVAAQSHHLPRVPSTRSSFVADVWMKFTFVCSQ